MKKGFIYFLRPVGSSRVRIGETTDLYQQLVSQSQYYPDGFEILGVICTSDKDFVYSEICGIFESRRHFARWYNISEDDVNRMVECYDSSGIPTEVWDKYSTVKGDCWCREVSEISGLLKLFLKINGKKKLYKR